MRLSDYAGGPPLTMTLAGNPVPEAAIGPVRVIHGRQSADVRPPPSTLSVALVADQLAALPELGDTLTLDLTPGMLGALGAVVDATGLRGSAAAPDTAGLSITGDLDVRVQLAATNWRTIPWGSFLLTKSTSGYRLFMSSSAIGFDWGGGTGVGRYVNVSSVTHLAGAATFADALDWDDGQPVWLRATLDADNGAGASVVSLYWSRDGAAWSLLRTATAATGGPADNSSALQVGANIGGASGAFPGVVYRAQVRSGIDGALAASPDWTAGPAGTDAQGNVWTSAAGATVTAAPYTDLDAPMRRRFVGTVTDAGLLPARGVVELTAAGAKARAALYPIGDVPWPAELDGDRAERILTALTEADPTITVGTVDPGTVTLLSRDVDRQPGGALLDDLAAYTGGDCWEDRAGALHWHDARHRQDVTPTIELAARHVLVDPRFTKTLDGLVTDLTVGYGLPVFDPVDGSTTQATVRVADTTAPIQQLASRVSTPIQSEDDASAYAIGVVGRRSRPRWRIPNLEVDVLRTLDDATRASLLSAQASALMRLVGMPTTAPWPTAQVWLEGWTETFTRYSWRMSLAVSPRGLTGALARWIDVPATWQPDPLDPATETTLTWLSEPFAGYSWIGAAGWWTDETPGDRWADVPAGLRWGTYPTTTEWGELP